MKVIRRPIVTTFLLLVVVSIVYFMTSLSTSQSLGENTPIGLSRYSSLIHSVPASKPLKGEEEDDDDRELPDEPAEADDNGGVDESEEVDEQVEVPRSQEVISQKTEDHEEDVEGIPRVESDYTETPFMPKMANETLKAQLGNAAWRLFHTILARYPDEPSKQEKSTLFQYIHLFAQVYPCGDCARHFQKLLKKYPPQIGSRKTAALWGCHIHNKVNDRLGKDTYDCTTILEDYDCGCGGDEQEEDPTLGGTMEHVRGIKLEEKELEPQQG